MIVSESRFTGDRERLRLIALVIAAASLPATASPPIPGFGKKADKFGLCLASAIGGRKFASAMPVTVLELFAGALGGFGSLGGLGGLGALAVLADVFIATDLMI